MFFFESAANSSFCLHILCFFVVVGHINLVHAFINRKKAHTFISNQNTKKKRRTHTDKAVRFTFTREVQDPQGLLLC
jgi:hypothetical protein